MTPTVIARATLVATVLFLIAAAPAFARTTWYVDDDTCPAAGDGSVGTPFCSVQAAIDAAVPGDEIVVAPGLYNEAIDLLGKAIALRSEDPADPAVVAATILDGTGLASSVITCATGEGLDTVIDGLTVANAEMDGLGDGGGLYVSAGAPTVRRCVFSGNAAEVGGGMYNLDAAPDVIACTFVGNIAMVNGGGMANNNSVPYVVDCSFLGNAAGNGGALHLLGGSDAIVTNGRFSGNTATTKGGAVVVNGSAPAFTNCAFTANSAPDAGGLHARSSALPVLVNCVLWNDVPDEITVALGAVVTATSCDIAGGFAGAGNIDVDPLFVDADGADDLAGTLDDDLRLDRYSPCVDAGDNGAPELAGIVADVDGASRFVDDADVADTGLGTAPIVDLGAHERQDDSGPMTFMLMPGDDIQAAIDATLDGDEIVLGAGTYASTSINLAGRAITLRSADPLDPAVVAATIVDGGGSGVVITCDSGEGADTIITGLTIQGGVGGNGGGMLVQAGSPTVMHCRFVGNTANNGAGIFLIGDAQSVIEDCLFEGNSAAFGGGGINASGFFMGLAPSPTVRRCTFTGNAGTTGAGGMDCGGGGVTVDDCIFESNVGGSVGALGLGNSSGTLGVTNCVFRDNSGGSAGAIWSNGTLTITGSVLVDNALPALSVAGGTCTAIHCTLATLDGDAGSIAAHLWTSTTTYDNCILWHQGTDGAITQEEFATVTMRFSDVRHGFPGPGNIDAPPILDAEGRLGVHSPCIDAGENAATDGAGITTDLDGNPRFVDDTAMVDTGSGAAPLVDMGAYERQVDSVNTTVNVSPVDTLQAAIDGLGNGDELVLAPGTYAQTVDLRGRAILLRSTDPTDPAVIAATVLDGTGLGDSVVTCITGEGPETIVDGLTITGGEGHSIGGSTIGGGVRIIASSPTITRCAITGNGADAGGGAYVFVGTPTFSDCAFSDNTGGSGGGIFTAADAALVGCTLTGNAAGYGGGIYQYPGSNALLDACAFDSNTAQYAGGAVFCEVSSPVARRCTFTANEVTAGGGGAWYGSGGVPKIVSCRFTDNTASSNGGAILHDDGQPRVNNCIFQGNETTIAASGTGGGAIATRNCTMIVANSTFSGNTTAGAGGAFHALIGTDIVTVRNSILWADHADLGAHDEFHPASRFEFVHCDVQGGAAGTGNIDADPMFEDADLRPSITSPCVDAGDDLQILVDHADLDGDGETGEPTPLDIDDDPRRQDTDLDGDVRVNMGAHETVDATQTTIVFNVTQGTQHPSIADAVAAAADGDLLRTGEPPFAAEPSIDLLGKELELRSFAALAQPAGGAYTLADGAVLAAATGEDVTIAGAVAIGSAQVVTVVAEQLAVTGTGGIDLDFAGVLDVDAPGGLLNDGTLDIVGTVVAGGGVYNGAVGQLVASGFFGADVLNDGTAMVHGDSYVAGDFTNNGTTTINDGTLSITGALADNGTIVGSVAGGVAGADNDDFGLLVGGDLTLGTGSTLLMPSPQLGVHVGGDFDVAIDDPARFAMAQAELEIVGAGVHRVEAMGTDAVPFTIGTFVVASGATVDLVNDHDNTGQTETPEGLFVTNLVVPAGATLVTGGITVVAQTAVIEGDVDDPGNIEIMPPCTGDTDGDDVVDVTDLVNLILDWGTDGSGHGGDVDGSGVVDVADLVELILAWGPCA